MSELKKEFKSYLNDLENNIENKKDLEYIKERTTEFMNVVLDQMENILKYKEEKISQIEKIQNDLEKKISTIQEEISDIEQDIYVEDVELEQYDDENEDNYDIQIVCPYCETEFLADLDQDNSEIECPNCSNIIELDWSGNLEEDTPNFGCGAGGCSGCHGCGNKDVKNDEEDDM